ncbi:hypothetical protein ABZ553_00775 [Streptomyces sparsogenes]|uniref:hypothetical protein n=1 Tax=Streptomyces sparsogenes TaxID=67365 RepID=UPI00340412FD
MMPGTITERHTAEAITPVAIRDLTGAERTVALYVSDMPNGRRNHANEQVRAWIVQGAERLGMEELRRRAEYFRGWRLLDMHGLATAQIQARHEQRFPKANRLIWADKTAAGNISREGMTEATRLRNGAAAVDGDCPCHGTGGIPVQTPFPDGSLMMLCPVHRRAEIDAHHRARRAGH